MDSSHRVSFSWFLMVSYLYNRLFYNTKLMYCIYDIYIKDKTFINCVFFIGTYHHAISADGQGLSDHM